MSYSLCNFREGQTTVAIVTRYKSTLLPDSQAFATKIFVRIQHPLANFCRCYAYLHSVIDSTNGPIDTSIQRIYQLASDAMHSGKRQEHRAAYYGKYLHISCAIEIRSL